MPFPEPLSPSDISSLWSAAATTREPIRDRAILAILLDTGVPRRALAHLRQADYDRDRSLIRVGPGIDRWLRIGLNATTAVSALSRSGGPEPLIVSLDGRPATDRTVHELLRRLGRSAGLVDSVTCRRTRRTWLRHALTMLPMPIVAALAGHRVVGRLAADRVIRAQHGEDWSSPLDAALARACDLRHAA